MLVLKDLREGMAQALDWPLGDVTYRLRYLQEAGHIPTGRGGAGGAVEATWEHAALLLLSLGAVQDAKNTSVPLAEHMMLAQPEGHSRDTELFGETLKDYLWGNIEPVTSDGILVKGDRTLVDVLSHIIRDAFVFLERPTTLFRLTIDPTENAATIEVATHQGVMVPIHYYRRTDGRGYFDEMVLAVKLGPEDLLERLGDPNLPYAMAPMPGYRHRAGYAFHVNSSAFVELSRIFLSSAA